ncbi:MAG: cytochrome c oxidase subunit I [Hyphomicrobium sp.]|nr:cytochrome c oxidase subunit I [Hyphomicrobium sp.]
MQLIVLVVSLALMAVVAYFFVAAVQATGAQDSTGDFDRRRSSLIWVLLSLGAIITVASLWQWPHAVSAPASSVMVNASGAQWYWDIDKEEVPLGKPVVFNVHTQDVTHGLGVMDPDGQLLFQTQAMPGYVNRVEYVFTKAGDYKVVCMEFCGIAHHAMITDFKVVEN